MKCPVDDVELVMADRQGVEIDYCPKCRGVWLDRGELDKIIERSIGGPSSGRADASDDGYGRSGQGGHGKGRGDHGKGHDDSGHGRDGRSRRRGLLGDIFDF